MNANSPDIELQLLETLYSSQGDDSALSQRELAGAAGISLGMTNALIRRFAERGWVKLTHVTGRSLKYILTASGVEEVVRRSLNYFTRAVRSASLYREKIEDFVRRAAGRGFSILVLEGPGELDFLFDYSCVRHRLEFVKNPSGRRREALASRPDAVFVQARFLRSGVGETEGTAAEAGVSGGTSEPLRTQDCESLDDLFSDAARDALPAAEFVFLADILFNCPPDAAAKTAGGS